MQVGAVAVTTPYSFGRRVSGFAVFGMTLEQFGAVGVRTPYSFGRRVSGFGVSFVAGVARFEGWVRRSLRAGTPPTPKIWNRGLTGLALGVCVCVCVCVFGCGWGPTPIVRGW